MPVDTRRQFNSHLTWNDLCHQISFDTSNFLLEFELVTLDPDRTDSQINKIISHIEQHQQAIDVSSVPASQFNNVERLKNELWTLVGVVYELQDTPSTNSRFQLYRDSIEFVAAINRNTLSINAESRVLSDKLKQHIDDVVAQSLDKKHQMKHLVYRHNLIVTGLSALSLVIVLLAFVSLFRLLSKRIGLLERYALDITNQDYKRPPFSSKDITRRLAVRMGIMSRTIRDGLISMKQSLQEIEKLAYYDTLTGLGNRRLFNENVEKAVLLSRRYAERYALVYLDLDFFKTINDSYGHDAGDKVLVQVAQRLRLTLREEDHIARLGAD